MVLARLVLVSIFIQTFMCQQELQLLLRCFDLVHLIICLVQVLFLPPSLLAKVRSASGFSLSGTPHRWIDLHYAGYDSSLTSAVDTTS